jgi:CO dehydrogenase/acetyl-CoA synthase delta subunit
MPIWRVIGGIAMDIAGDARRFEMHPTLVLHDSW